MAEICVKLPDELKEFSDADKSKWQLLLQKKLNTDFDRIARLKRIVSKSKLTKKDVEELSDKINESLSERYLKMNKG